MDNTLVVEVYQSLKHLGDVDRNKIFGEFAKLFDDVVQRSILAEPVDRGELRTYGRGDSRTPG